MKRFARWNPLPFVLISLLLPVPISYVVAQTPANHPPTLEDPLKEGTVDKVLPNVPVGKSLVLPIAAGDVDGDALSYKVKSSNGKIHVRARTGQPHLKLGVRHTSSGGDDVAFEGELDFQILREWTPEAAGFINGFAQSNYYMPRAEGTATRHTIFHRVIKDFMAQTGDPNGHTRNQKVGTTPILHGPGFNFNDEFHPGLIFTGRGQMAMANAGFDGFYNGSNNSQWFVTMGQPRHLDFNHTVFGQLVRGWDLLDKINVVRVQDQPARTDLEAGVPDLPAPEQNSSPINPIEITSSTVVPNLTDAVLVISAEAPGTSTITVTVQDGKGGEATKTFTVTAEDDIQNSPPFLAFFPQDGPLSSKNGEAFGLQALDLEADYLFLSSLTLTGDAISQVVGNSVQVFPLKWSGSNSTAPTTGKQLIGMTVSEFDMTGTRSSDTEDKRATTFVIGEKPFTAEGLPVSGAPGVEMTVPVATFADSDARGDKSGYGARVNWGDGSTPILATAAEIVRDPTKPSLVSYQVKGTHKYDRPGTYVIKVNLESTSGLKKSVRTIAVISADPVKVFGEALTAQGTKVANQILATIEDSAPAQPGAYATRINWGDGTATSGLVKRAGSGQLYVTGTHEYRDTDSYSVLVEVTKEGTAPATGWATVRAVNAKAARTLPPFPRSRVISDIVQIAAKTGSKPYLSTVGTNLNAQTMATLGVVVISHGAETVKPFNIRFYLSADRNLNLEDEEYEDTSVDPPVTRINPADIPVTVGKKKKALKIIALKPGVGGQVSFDKTTADTRLYFPKREPGVGYYLIAHFDYKDPLVAPRERFAVEDLGTPISFVAVRDNPRPNDGSPTVELMENGDTYTTGSFRVRIGRRPSKEVKIPLTIAGIFGQPDPSEFYFTDKPPAPDKYLTESPDHEVIFTPEMWDQGTKEVTVGVTAKNDNVAETSDQKLQVRINGAKSDDPLFQNRTASPLVVYVRDVNANVTVSKTAITTKEPNVNGTFEIALRSPFPLAGKTVNIKLTSGNPAEGKLSVDGGAAANEINIVLTAATTKKTITVVAQDDTVDETTNPQYTITIHPTVSDDPNYHNVDPLDITVTNEDND